jgi:hypothetical protein
MKQKRRCTVSVLLALVMLALLTGPGVGLVSKAEASAAEWGVDDARTPTGDWDELGPGEGQWYAFQYAGDGSQVQVRLEAVPEGSASFVVWTPELIGRWGSGVYVEPVGRGSVDPNATGQLIWSGAFNTAGTYYVVVEPTGNLSGSNQSGASYYLLDVSGSGVSLEKSTPAPTSEPAKTSAQGDAPREPAGPREPSGTLVFQTTYGGPFYTIHVDGSGLQRITNGIDPVWSPDGRQIAFVRWEEPRGVWVVDVDSGNEWRTFDWSETRYPSWSPDGSQIVFTRQSGGGGGGRPPGGVFAPSSSAMESEAARRPPPGGSGGRGSSGGSWTLGIVNLYEGTFAEPQPDSTVNLAPDWSPDGEQIVYNAEHGLRIMSVDGKSSYALTNLPKDTSPVWSPDGSQVAFVRWQHDHWEVYVVNADGRGLTRLTNTPALSERTPSLDGAAANSVSPAWSPDGNYIAFLTDRSGKWEIWRSDARGGGQMPMFDSELDGLTLDYAFAGERAISWTD